MANNRTGEILNKSLPVATTEYSQLIPAGTRQFTISSRLMGTLRIALNSGETTTKYLTIPAGASKTFKDLAVRGLTLYVQSDTGSDVMEVECWKDTV